MNAVSLGNCDNCGYRCGCWVGIGFETQGLVEEVEMTKFTVCKTNTCRWHAVCAACLGLLHPKVPKVKEDK